MPVPGFEVPVPGFPVFRFSEYLPGDVNYDGKVNILDLIFVRNSLGRDPASFPAARKADLNNDGKVNVLDLIAARNGLQR